MLSYINFIRRNSLYCAISLLLLPIRLNGQYNSLKPVLSGVRSSSINTEKRFTPIVAFEAWATYNLNGNNTGLSDLSLRRLRIGAKGQPFDRIQYSFQFHSDRLGQNTSAATRNSDKGFGLWNAYISARLIQNSQLLNLHLGYFWTATSREFNTSPWAVASFDKNQSAWYLRQFTTGKGNGIENGIALGGIKNFENIGFSYRLGLYEPKAYTIKGASNNLLTMRIMVSFGDPEQTRYKYMLTGNQWHKRKGITLGFGGSEQAEGFLSDSLFYSNARSYGTDLLIDYNDFRLEGEYYVFQRSNSELGTFDGKQWHLRTSYSFFVKDKIIEAIIAFGNYRGLGNKVLFKYIGYDKTFDVGVNYYIKKNKLKISAHYIIQDNDFKINSGDYAGISFQIRL